METSVPMSLSLNAGTSGGGGGGGVPRRFSRTHLPRTGGDVRVGYDDTVRMDDAEGHQALEAILKYLVDLK